METINYLFIENIFIKFSIDHNNLILHFRLTMINPVNIIFFILYLKLTDDGKKLIKNINYKIQQT